MFDSLLDENMNKVIASCFINGRYYTKKIFVIYEDKTRENIWTYDSRKIDFYSRDFVGMCKIEAVFYCDQRTRELLMNDKSYPNYQRES